MPAFRPGFGRSVPAVDARPRDRDDPVVVATRAGDEPMRVARLVERHRRELRVHCYRMLGSIDEAEDMVQETFLRAWRHIGGFEGRSTLRAWLYRIVTNACLDALGGRARRVLPQDLEPPTTAAGAPFGSAQGRAAMVARTDLPWLQPLPDRLWEPAADPDAEPDAVAVTRETIELAFIAALQHLPPRRRAVLVLRDVLGWPARQTAEHLGLSEAAVTSALHRARTTLRSRLPARRADWAPAAEPTAEERAVVRRYMAAVERADLATVADLLAEDVRTAMPPWTRWLAGRPAVLAALRETRDPRSPDHVGRFRRLEVRANGQPAVAGYLRAPGDPAGPYRAFAVGVLRVEAGRIAEIVTFHEPGLFAAFGLPDLTVNGPDLAQHAFRAGLVDEVQVYVCPFVSGGGKPGLPRGMRLVLELLASGGSPAGPCTCGTWCGPAIRPAARRPAARRPAARPPAARRP